MEGEETTTSVVKSESSSIPAYTPILFVVPLAPSLPPSLLFIPSFSSAKAFLQSMIGAPDMPRSFLISSMGTSTASAAMRRAVVGREEEGKAAGGMNAVAC